MTITNLTAGGAINGEDNEIFDTRGTVGGGLRNQAGIDDADPNNATEATVGGGAENKANDSFATVAGGLRNQAGNGNSDQAGQVATVAGGEDNTASGKWATIGGGLNNNASQVSTTVGGGNLNKASDSWSTVGGGLRNQAGNGNSDQAGQVATVAGGEDNTASGKWATIGGGESNTATSQLSTVAGGASNVADGPASFIGGGFENSVFDTRGTIGGGFQNEAGTDDGDPENARNATVGGGSLNKASGGFATIPGGSRNTASGKASFAAGVNAEAAHDFSFVWSDGSNFSSREERQFAVNASGGVFIRADVRPDNAVGADGRSNNGGHALAIHNGYNNGANGVLIQLNESSQSRANNYLTFETAPSFDSEATVTGRIEGFNMLNGTDLLPPSPVFMPVQDIIDGLGPDADKLEFYGVKPLDLMKSLSGVQFFKDLNPMSGLARKLDDNFKFTNLAGNQNNGLVFKGLEFVERICPGDQVMVAADKLGDLVGVDKDEFGDFVNELIEKDPTGVSQTFKNAWDATFGSIFGGGGGDDCFGLGFNLPSAEFPQGPLEVFKLLIPKELSDTMEAIGWQPGTQQALNPELVSYLQGLGAGIPTDPLDIIFMLVDMAYAVNANHGGVVYESGSGDFAEWLPRLNTDESLRFGQIVGVYGRKVTRHTAGADQVMVVSMAPAVLGNMPPKGQEDQYEKIAFIGQVPIWVEGPVLEGDYILPSGDNNGVGIAVRPDSMQSDQFAQVVGRSWTSSPVKGLKLVNTAVGMEGNSWTGFVRRIQQRLDAQAAVSAGLSLELEAQARAHTALSGQMETMVRDSAAMRKELAAMRQELTQYRLLEGRLEAVLERLDNGPAGSARTALWSAQYR